MLLLGSIRSIMIICIVDAPPVFNSLFDPFGSPSRGQKPSLPLRKAPPLISVFFNGLYTPFGSPVSGGQLDDDHRQIVRDGTAWGREFTIYNLKLIVYSLLIGGAWGRGSE